MTGLLWTTYTPPAPRKQLLYASMLAMTLLIATHTVSLANGTANPSILPDDRPGIDILSMLAEDPREPIPSVPMAALRHDQLQQSSSDLTGAVGIQIPGRVTESSAHTRFQGGPAFTNPGIPPSMTQNNLVQLSSVESLASVPDASGPENSSLAEIIFETRPIDDARKLQIALQLIGYYLGEIDGIFGSGSFAGLNRFLTERNLPTTETLDDPLVETVYQELEELYGNPDFQWLSSRGLGMRIITPADAVTYGHTLPPYVFFRPKAKHALSMTLISISGDLERFKSLREFLIDHFGSNQRRAPFTDQEFSIAATQDGMDIYARVIRVKFSDIRGVILSWPRNQAAEFRDMARLIASTVTRTSKGGFLLTDETQFSQIDDFGTPTPVTRSPSRIGSGFYLGLDGHVITSYRNVGNCGQILVDTILDYTVLDADPAHDLALLAPKDTVIPYVIAGVRSRFPSPRSDVLTAGYPHNDSLSDPTVVRRSLQRLSSTDGMDPIVTLDGPVARGEIGGPVADHTGAVIGMLASPQTTITSLPTGYAVVSSADLMVEFLSRNAVNFEARSPAGPRDVQGARTRMQDYTIPVHCYSEQP